MQSVVDGIAVLVRHNVHLVKMDLWNVGIGANIDVFLRNQGDGGRRLFGVLRGSNDGDDVVEDLYWFFVDGDDDAVA